tara:strand:- start:7608 stop:7895 length:288 start_codon:yes stop_codon:yes gene_type:complete
MRLAQPVNVEDLGALVSDWTLVFELRSSRGNTAVLTVNGALSTISRAADLGIYDFVLPASNTAALSARTYYYAIRRTDNGYADVLSRGQTNVESF